MENIRVANVDDAPTIAAQRVKMFQDNNYVPVAPWEALEHNMEAWIRSKLHDGTYAGWLVEDGLEIIAGAGVWFMEFPPHWMHPEPMRPYLLNFYVSPQFRGRGLVKRLMDLAVAESSRRGAHLAVLHASPMGRPIYEKLGWADTGEMMLRLKT